MSFIKDKILYEGLTFDDVLLVPSYSEVLPREVDLSSMFTRNIRINTPVVSAAMDTVTEDELAIAIAREGGIGVIHKNMTIEKQAAQVKRVKRAENVMIFDPITINLDATVAEAIDLMSEYKIGGIPVIDKHGILKGIVTNRDLRFENNHSRKILRCDDHNLSLQPIIRPTLRQPQGSFRNTRSKNFLWLMSMASLSDLLHTRI